MTIDPDRFATWVSEEADATFRAMTRAPLPLLSDVAVLRAHYDAFNCRYLAEARSCYPVEVAEDEIAGVRVQLVSPRSGDHDGRTLICLHGGAFIWGRGAGALLEAVPVASVAKVKVVAVEYALSPEKEFPAAVDDVLAVYEQLLGQQSAKSIGMYGCSAGGVLTAQVAARIIADGLPSPGAIAMLCGTGLEAAGDSAMSAPQLNGLSASDIPTLASLPHFANANPTDPLVFPGGHPGVLAKFPPSLLVTGSRDFAASSVTVMHRRLIAAGATASLLHFDGMWHAFHMATTIPEARETFDAMGQFFASHLS